MTVLLEREAQLAELDAVIAAAASGTGAAVVVAGDAGAGKSTLLAVAGLAAEDRGLQVLWARGGALERDFGFGVVRQILEPVVLRADDARRRLLLTGAARLAEPVLGLAGEQERAPGAGAAEHGLYWLAANLAAEAPVLICVDDAQWADDASLRWLAYLAARLEGVALGLIVAWRTGEPGAPGELFDTLRVSGSAREVAAPPLTADAVAELVRGRLGPDAVATFCAACHEVTGGNPFLVDELIDRLAQDGVAPSAEHIGRVRALGPQSVARSVVARLSALGDDAGALARAVAVLDTDAELRFAAAVAGLDHAGALRAAEDLVEARLLGGGHELRFAHPILRAAVYEDMSAPRRIAGHRRAADALHRTGDPDRAAVHLLATDPAADAEVVSRLHDAAQRAIRRGAPDTAFRLLERALAEPPAPSQRAQLLVAQARAGLIAGEDGADDLLRAALATATEPVLHAEAAESLAQALWTTGHPEQAGDVLAEAIALLPETETEGRRRMELDRAVIDFSAGRPLDELAGRLQRIRRDCAPGSQLELLASLFSLYVCFVAGRPPDAALLGDVVARAEEVAAVVPSVRPDFAPMIWASVALTALGCVRAGRRVQDELVSVAQATGNAWAFASAIANRSRTSLLLGDVVDAEADARAALDAAAVGGWHVQRAVALMSLVFALVLRGRADEAGAILREHDVLDGEVGPTRPERYLYYARAYVRVHQGRFAEARADLDRWNAQWIGVTAAAAHFPVAVPALVGTGDRAAARTFAAEQLRIARRAGVPDAIGNALYEAGLAEEGEEAIRLLGEAVEVLGRTERSAVLGAALVDLGAALRRAKRRADAREPLRRGMELAYRCGMTGVAARAREELAATGARPRRIALSGADALTASERRVAEMAVKGMSNPEIAQSLFVTRRTIETHLAHAYQKLGIVGRTELGAALGAPATEQAPPVRSSTRVLTVMVLRDAGDDAARRALVSHGGHVLPANTGDVVAVFDSPSAAVRCAAEIRVAAPRVRVGLHAGEAEVVEHEVRGLTLELASRLAALAKTGEIVATATVRDLTLESGARFCERGVEQFPGVPGEWPLVALAR